METKILEPILIRDHIVEVRKTIAGNYLMYFKDEKYGPVMCDKNYNKCLSLMERATGFNDLFVEIMKTDAGKIALKKLQNEKNN